MLLDKLRSGPAERGASEAGVTGLLLRWLPFITLVAMALIATLDYGNGNIIGEGVADLHIDPVGFLKSLLYTWDPKPFLGSHQGFTQVYLTPYTFFYALFAFVHLPAITGQRIIVFLIYLWVAGGMYWGLKYIAPAMNWAGRLAGAAAYLFNIYVAFNSAGSVPMLLTYGALPWMTGAIAAGMDGALPALTAGALTAVFVFVGSGENPPIIALNAVLIALFIISYFLWEGVSRQNLLRFAKTAVSAAAFSIALNLYWIVPFLGYIKTAWIGGVLDESPLMHNADSSFANVFRGLGQWAIFQWGPSGPYYSWAHAYQTGQLYSFLLWLVPIFGVASLLFRGRRSRAVPFFLLVCFVSMPLAVGYYRGPLGDAITEPIYNLLYRFVPDFQMFRSAYKWVGGNEFGIAGLFAVFAAYAYDWVRPRLRGALAAAAVALPLVVYIPIIIFKANYAMAPLPPWTAAESAMVGSSPSTRVALFPSQYLEQFHWGNPGYYMEHALMAKPMLYGYLGAATNESSDQWLRLAYRRTRQGYPDATAILRMLSVSDVLQRDDFRSVQDFSFPEGDVTSNVTIAHDDLTRVLGLRQSKSVGANRLYPVPGALPLVYGASAPRIAPGPAVSVASSSDVHALAGGEPVITLDGLTPSQVAQALASGAVVSHSPSVLDDYATTLLMAKSGRVEAQYPRQPFQLAKSTTYRVSAMNLGLDYHYPLQKIAIDGHPLKPIGRQTRAWQYLGTLPLRAGVHRVTANGAGYVTPILVVFTPVSAWNQERADVATLFAHAAGDSVTVPVKRRTAVIQTAVAGRYTLSATRAPQFAPLYESHPLTAPRGEDAANVRSAPASQFQLPYVLGQGVDPSQIQPLPGDWYENAGVYSWNRSAAVHWWLLSDDAHFIVYSPANHPVAAELQMRFASLAPVDTLTVRSPLGSQSVPVHGAATTGVAASRPLAAYLQLPQTVNAPVRLRPGMNVIRIGCDCHQAGLPAGLVSDVLAQEQQRYIGAVLADMAIVTRDPSAASYAFKPQWSVPGTKIPGGTLVTVSPSMRGAFKAVALPVGDSTLNGDPFLEGRIVQLLGSGTRLWVAEAVSERGVEYYRLSPIQDPNGLNISLAEALPNSDSDEGAKITGLWLLASHDPLSGESQQPSVFALMDLAQMRTGVVPASETRASLPLRVDGKVAGSSVYLNRGVHVITAENRDAQLNTLTISRGKVPAAGRVPLSVRYVSPTRVVATLPAATKPFLLVLNESYYGLWHANIGKNDLVHVQANGFANGWIVPASPAGTQIVMNFSAQQRFIKAAAISAIAALAIIVLLLMNWVQVVRRKA